MEWRDEGMILVVRPHGETTVIVEALTKAHGRHAGVVRGGSSRKMKPVLQRGSQVQLDWNARLETHMGTFRVEPLKSRLSHVLGDRIALEGLNSICALTSFCLGEREPVAQLYGRTVALADGICADADWLADYARWEAELLSELGFGLDLSACASTGQTSDLIYVSPKSGRAVSREAGQPWSDRMLPLPSFLIEESQAVSVNDVLSALATTGYFLRANVAPALGKAELPPARERLISALERQART